MNKLAEKSMLVTLTVNSWETNVHDRSVSKDVAERNGAQEEAGRYIKRLLTKEAVKEINTLATRARQLHYFLTMPWDKHGYRLLPIALYNRYKAGMDNLIEQRLDARNRMLSEYKTHIRRARKYLGKMFKKDQYPPVEEVRERIAMSYQFFPVPDSSHFIASLADLTEAQHIRASIQSQVEERTQEAVTELFQRLADATDRVSDRLALVQDESGEVRGKIFQDSIVETTTGLLDVLPGLNITSDPLLDDLVSRARAGLEGVRPSKLRLSSDDFSPSTHEAVKSTMDDISERLKGYFGGN